MKIKVVIPYFGKLPDYFDLFLKSCEINSEIEFLIFTDQKVKKEYPTNVTVYHTEFEVLKKKICCALNLSKSAMKNFSPYKLCDFRPTYGLIFEDYLKDSDYWGYCDVDLIFGKIFDILDIGEVAKSERILTQGHLTLYKNCPKMNHMFKLPLKGGINFDKVITYTEPCFFDEIFMPAICKSQNVIQYGDNCFADILPQYNQFVVAPTCTIKNVSNQKFYWENGRLLREYTESGNKMTDSLMYIHLQKRKLDCHYSYDDLKGRIYITPQGFFSASKYSEQCEMPSSSQKKIYFANRWKGFTPRKIWIKIKAEKFKEILS
ncbi:DUF6625 family protein [Faecalibacterium sp. An192]|uniref:DUF6625 family protein n=1 Tax=Faecalibacterium sp. An192 TaxID=1965581 RepID=UPI000B3932B3|nr:DUF6625 family protein [Faecalibacterium sp. An192]OUP27849.1 hypothetical protein B5F27_08595 [Faecalibacterium sp. An192]